MSQPFSRLLEIHLELENIFLLHGECLLAGEFDLSRDVLESYRTLLQLHMQHEEAVLLPLYFDLGVAPGFPLVLYTGQHAKLNAMLDSISRHLAGLEGNGQAVRRQVLALFDRETTFKHLSEHHDGAERDGLFARLDAAVATDRAELLLSPLWTEWWHVHSQQSAPLARARAL